MQEAENRENVLATACRRNGVKNTVGSEKNLPGHEKWTMDKTLYLGPDG